MDQQESRFRFIRPEEFSQYGIDPLDVPMGSFAAEDHPGFLPSRFGGNAYGLGLIEQGSLTASDIEFLEKVDFQDHLLIGLHAKRLNSIYQRLGLLIRFTTTGKSYFLIPINLVAHSLQEIKSKADEIEELIIRHIWETRTERLDIGLLTSGQDLIVHELTARLSSHRIMLFDSLEKLRSWRIPLDIVILPKDLFEYLLDQKLPRIAKGSLNRQRLFQYAMYLAGKVYDLLEPSGKLLVLAHSPIPKEDVTCRVRFKSEADLKSFLLFSHIFNTRRGYEADSSEKELEVFVSDLHYYLGRFTFSEPHLRQLLNGRRIEDLGLEQINALPRLHLRMPQAYVKNPEKPWKWIFEPYFITNQLRRKSPKHHHQYWSERLEIDRELPESLLVFVGKRRQPDIELCKLEEEIRSSGTMGCSLPLVAAYRNTFRYVLDVLRVLIQIRDNDFLKISELERARLSNPFRSRNENFYAVVRLLGQISKLEKIRDVLNPDHIEGQYTPVLENIPKLSLHGLTPAQIREILLIVVGHSTMSRVTLGKLPAKALKPITDRVEGRSHHETLEMLRVYRLMSMAEIAAALGDAFTGEQAGELYRIYDDAMHVATDPKLDWEKLNDLRISALGGVQNKAIREMMKLFNLFDFLDNWLEFQGKGALEREVVCDYQHEKLLRLEETLELAKIAGEFKLQFVGDHLFGQSYLFRQFLESEFHGTGHLFPKLGARAGFILLWTAVNSSERHILNFNPMLAGIGQDSYENRIQKIKETLLKIPINKLHPEFFEEVKKVLAEGLPAFIFDSGIRIISNPETHALDISFIDIDENLQKIDVLLTYFESQRLRGISLPNLKEMERLYSEIDSFHHYLEKEGCFLRCDLYNRTGGLEAKDLEIEKIELRLKSILQSQIFIPEEIHDTISVLAKHCPEMLRTVLPELQAFGNLIEAWPTRQKQSLGMYVMRCLAKFQALVMKDRNLFQDRNAFYQQAKQEFGPLAEEGVGASHAQLDILEYLVERIQQTPLFYHAMIFALLFQDIGKIDQHSNLLPEGEVRWTHAEQSALILERSEVLKRYSLDHQLEQSVIYLVRHHGQCGHVIQGEEPITALEPLTAQRDDRLSDVLVLHSILAAAAVEEGLMVSDLLDLFLGYRSTSLELIKAKTSWSARLREILREKGEAVLADFQLVSNKERIFPRDIHYCGFSDDDIEDEPLWQGRQTAALERLFKLMGIQWVDYLDVQMYLLKVPINFIYHKRKLKSIGPVSFERSLTEALRLLSIISSLTPEVRYYLLYNLDHLGGAMRIYDFHPLSRFLEPQESLKLILIALQVYHKRFGPKSKAGLISFRPLGQLISRRRETIQNLLRDLPFPERCFCEGAPFPDPAQFGELLFLAHPREQALQIDYRDSSRYDLMARSLRDIWRHDELVDHHRKLLQELQDELPYDTKVLEEELQVIFEEQGQKINDRIIHDLRARLGSTEKFTDLQMLQQEIRQILSIEAFSEEQQLLIMDLFEFHRSRLRDRYLSSLYRKINSLDIKALASYWDELKHELYSFRAYVGKEYESLMASYIDKKLSAPGREQPEKPHPHTGGCV